MKKIIFLLVIGTVIILSACKKEAESENFRLLTAHVWKSDSLLADGVDQSGPGQILEKFKGEVVFNKDGTGTFGEYDGTWRFSYSENELVIESPDLQLPLSTNIVELTAISLKVTTAYPNVINPSDPLDIRMTFKPR